MQQVDYYTNSVFVTMPLKYLEVQFSMASCVCAESPKQQHIRQTESRPPVYNFLIYYAD